MAAREFGLHEQRRERVREKNQHRRNQQAFGGQYAPAMWPRIVRERKRAKTHRERWRTQCTICAKEHQMEATTSTLATHNACVGFPLIVAIFFREIVCISSDGAVFFSRCSWNFGVKSIKSVCCELQNVPKRSAGPSWSSVVNEASRLELNVRTAFGKRRSLRNSQRHTNRPPEPERREIPAKPRDRPEELGLSSV